MSREDKSADLADARRFATTDHHAAAIAWAEDEIARLRQLLEDVYLKDRGRTNEHNILVRENRALAARIKELEGRF